MLKVLLVTAVLGLTGSTVTVAQAERPSTEHAARVRVSPVQDWQAGVRAGTTKFSAVPGATCKPKLGTRASDRRCKLTISGKFTATDRGYKGTYAGTATVNYPDPANSDYAAFDSGSVTYQIRNLQGQLLDTVTMYIDLGTGGVTGYPYDLSIGYWYEERHDGDPDLVVRSEGVGINQLDASLNPIRTFVDRLAYG
jgi:hypothetical protein